MSDSSPMKISKEEFHSAYISILATIVGMNTGDRIAVLGSVMAATIHEDVYAAEVESVVDRVATALKSQLAGLQQQFPDPRDPTVSTLVPPAARPVN